MIKLIERCRYEEDKALVNSLCEVELEKFEKWFDELVEINNKDKTIFYNGDSLYWTTGVKC